MDGQQRNPKLFGVLHKLVRICETHDIPYWVVGGLALDAKRGKITRSHGDIDICLLENDVRRTQRILFQNGFQITQQGLKFVFYKAGVKIDVFPLTDRGNFFERKREWFEAKYPKAIFTNSQNASIDGQKMTIPSNTGLRYYGEKSSHAADKKFATSLPYDKKLFSGIYFHVFADYRQSIKNVKVRKITFHLQHAS